MNELEVHGEGFNDGRGSEPRGKGLIFAALGLGAFGVIVGITGIVSANSATKEVAALRRQVLEGPGSEQGLRDELRLLDERITQVDQETARNGNTLREMRDQMQGALDKVAAQLPRSAAPATNRPTAAANTPAPTTGTGSGGPAAAAPAQGTRVHTIVAGDNFSKLARQYGTTVDAITAANPGVDSSKLQLGQKVNIP
jgi:LysM repeat protein